MPETLRLREAAILFVVAIFAAGPAAAVEVPIVNPDFEADSLPSPGADQPTITGWDTTSGGGDGIFRPTASDYPTGIPSGQNVAYVNLSGNRVRQVLSTPLEANTRYVLKVEVGWNNNDPFDGYIVQLRVNTSTVLAEDNSSQMPVQGSFVTSTVELVTGPDPEHLGAPLEIWLRSPGIQANFDDVRMTAEAVGPCTEELVLPLFLFDANDPSGTNTLYAVRNLTGDPVNADVEYLDIDGTSQRVDSLTLGAFETRTVSLRDVPGLAADPDGLGRGFVRIVAAGRSDGAPVLAGDFFQIDVANNFATGNQLLRSTEACSDSSVRFLDFGSGTRLAVYVTQPRGADQGADPPSFTLQVYDEAGDPVGAPQPVWTADHALELSVSDFTALSFGNLGLDFSNSLGGTAYAEYSAGGRFSVGVVSQCHESGHCEEDCCPPGSPKTVVGGLHYPKDAGFPDCATAIDDALRSLDSFPYRNACQEAYGGDVPDAVLGARVVDCQVDPPNSEGNVVVAVEACCPLP
ncbi:MAG: hypothetical protein ACOC7L_04055, partial [Acidobacteriota bacterium]